MYVETRLKCLCTAKKGRRARDQFPVVDALLNIHPNVKNTHKYVVTFSYNAENRCIYIWAL